MGALETLQRALYGPTTPQLGISDGPKAGTEGLVPSPAKNPNEAQRGVRGSLVPNAFDFNTRQRQAYGFASLDNRLQIYRDIDFVFANDPILSRALELSYVWAIGMDCPTRKTFPKYDTRYSQAQARLANRISDGIDKLVEHSELQRWMRVFGRYGTCPIQHIFAGLGSEMRGLESMPPHYFKVCVDSAGRILKGQPRMEGDRLVNPAYIQYDISGIPEVGRFRYDEITWGRAGCLPWELYGIPPIFPSLSMAKDRIESLLMLKDMRKAGFPLKWRRTKGRLSKPEQNDLREETPLAKIERGESVTPYDIMLMFGEGEEAGILNPGTGMYSDLRDLIMQGNLVCSAYGIPGTYIAGIEELHPGVIQPITESIYDNQLYIFGTARDELFMPPHKAAWARAGIDATEIETNWTCSLRRPFSQLLQEMQAAVQFASQQQLATKVSRSFVAKGLGQDPDANERQLAEEERDGLPERLYAGKTMDAPQLQAGAPQGTVLPINRRFMNDGRQTNNTTGMKK